MDRWQTRLIHANPYARWLRLWGSLTDAMTRRCPAFNVVRLDQSPGLPHRDEEGILGLPPGRLAVIREVLLRCDDHPMVFAHSVIPRAGLRGPWVGLAGLGSRPLGAALFSDPRIQRQPLQFRRLDRRHPLYRKACRHLDRPPPALWARRSLFALQARPILVTEVFLPDILRLP